MYKLKQIPEDFVVKEISNVKVLAEGNYSYWWLEKKEWNTLDSVKRIARGLGLREKEIGFAGSKDKKAITRQVISLKRMKKEKVESLELKEIKLEFYGYGNVPICLGDLEGNAFEIVVRNLENFKFGVLKEIVNYFDEQRFGENNVEVGRGLIKKNFAKVCELLELEVKRNDYIGAIKTIPKRLLRLYVNAYQSYLWNMTVDLVLEKGLEVKELPLIGFGTSLEGEVGEIIKEVMMEEELELRDWVIKQIPELSLEGDVRKVMVPVIDLKVLEKGEDGLNEGKKKIKISFSLGKGSYATRVIKELFSGKQ